MKKMYHGQLLDFLVRFGGGNDPLNFQNQAIGGFWENTRFIRSNGRKTTFEWAKVVSEVIFPRFWGVVCFSAIATYKTRIFSKSSNGPILKI